MAELRKLFESSEIHNVKTISSSRNVIFSTPETNLFTTTKRLERKLENKLGSKVSVILRKLIELEDLVNSKPFKQINITPHTKMYLTFLSHMPKYFIKVPFESSDKDFSIIRITDTEVHSVATVLPNTNPGAKMSFLDKEFGKNITTRNYNTVVKCLK